MQELWLDGIHSPLGMHLLAATAVVAWPGYSDSPVRHFPYLPGPSCAGTRPGLHLLAATDMPAFESLNCCSATH